jgi:hypothetical protein
MAQVGLVPVTAENFARAETDLYFGGVVKDGGLGKFHHFREPTPLDHQTVVRMNRDTLYSSLLLDLDAGPATITLPDAQGRFRSMQVINEDQYTIAVNYQAGAYTLDREKVGTRYVVVALRTLVDPNSPEDIEQVHGLQDATSVQQPGGPGKFEVPAWDPESQTKVRQALAVLGSTLPDSRRMFGARDKVDPIRFLIGSAVAWGGNPETEAMYVNVVPRQNDGKTVYRVTVKDVPVDGFWSISLYNADGYFEKNDRDAYTINNVTAKRNADGSVSVQFGGCDGTLPNCLPITPGWNYLVRLYRPHPEILEGRWKFPEATPVDAEQAKSAEPVLEMTRQ